MRLRQDWRFLMPAKPRRSFSLRNICDIFFTVETGPDKVFSVLEELSMRGRIGSVWPQLAAAVMRIRHTRWK